MLTATTINGGYLNFLGNEFGHPEWMTSRVKVMAGHVNMPVVSGIW